MRIEKSVVRELVDAASRLQLAAVVPADCGRINVDMELHALRERLATRIDENLQPWFLLLDESIQFLVQFERYLYEFSLSRHLTGFAVTVSKLKRDVISIRDLLAIGQDVTARVLARTFVEDVEIAMALASSAETCEAFATTCDTNEFWNTHVGYGKVYDKVRQYLLACGIEEERALSFVDRHREAKKMFSESTHGGRESSLMSAFSPSLTSREEVHFLSLGALTHVTAQLALFVAQETHAFAGSVVKGVMVPSPLHLYRDFSITGRFINAASSAHVLQELLVRYEAEMENEQAKFA
jgi:predicted Rdx family selenoprotein